MRRLASSTNPYWPLLLVWLIALAFSFRVGQTARWFDSGDYWPEPWMFKAKDGGFDLAAWSTPLRGYFVPFVGATVTLVQDAVGIPTWIGEKLVFCFAMAVLGATVIPALMAEALGVRATALRRLVVAGLLLFFWRGYMLYPLSDVLALALVGGGMLFALRATRAERRAWLPAGLAGLLLAAGINLRPAYLVAMAVFLVAWIVVLALRRQRSDLLLAYALVLGVAVIWLPQSWINVQHDRSANPTHFETVEGKDLYLITLDYGPRYPKFLYAIGDPRWPTGGIRTRDLTGDRLWSELIGCCAEGNPPEFGYGDYARAVSREPVAWSLLYGRHVINGLDTWHATPYVDEVLPVSRTFRIANYVVWFAALVSLVVLWRRAGFAWTPSRTLATAGAAGLLLATIIAVPGGVETRFYLPAYVLAYALVAFVLIPERWRRPTTWQWLLAAPVLVTWCVVLLQHSDALIARLEQ